MKRLIIVRHAKTEQGGYSHDYERELTERGIDDAGKIAVDLFKRKIMPDYILSSPATRAITTAKVYAATLNFPEKKIIEKEGLYFDFTTQDFIEMLHEVPDEYQTVFVFGHNPFMYFMAGNLSKNFHGEMPTCSTVVIDFEIGSWKEVEPRQGKVFLHLYPKLVNFEG